MTPVFAASFTAICADPYEARIAAVLYAAGERCNLSYREIARQAECCLRVVADRVPKLMARAWAWRPPTWSKGQRSRLDVNRAAMDAELLRAGYRQPMLDWIELVRGDPQSNAQPTHGNPQTDARPMRSDALLVENYASVCGSPPTTLSFYKCSGCGLMHASCTSDQQVRDVPMHGGASEVVHAPSKDSISVVSTKEKYSSKGADASVLLKFGDKPKTIDELLGLCETRPKLRKVLPDYEPYVQTEIVWEHSEADYKAVEALVRQLAEKWHPGSFHTVPTDRALLHGILQAAPLPVIEAEVQRLKGCAPAMYSNSTGPYLRSSLWEKARGVKWSDLPYEFTRDRIRKPMGSERAVAVAAAVKRF